MKTKFAKAVAKIGLSKVQMSLCILLIQRNKHRKAAEALTADLPKIETMVRYLTNRPQAGK